MRVPFRCVHSNRAPGRGLSWSICAVITKRPRSPASRYFDRSPHGGKIRLHIGSALDIAPKLGGEFDLVFIDGDKREYPAYYRMLMGDDGSKALVHSGSVLIADNILWSGKVVQPVAHNDRHTQALLEFNRMVVEDARVENVIVPLRDGLNLIRVK